MKYQVTHTTELDYDFSAGLCYNEARLRPRDLPWQQVESSRLEITPVPHDLYDRLDYFGNPVTYFSLQQPHDKLVVTAISKVTVTPSQGLSVEQFGWEEARRRLRQDTGPVAVEALQFALDSPMVVTNRELAAYAGASFAPGRALDEAVTDLMGRIFAEFNYDPEFSSIATPLKEVLAHRRGVCQDFAHLAIGCLRSMGVAARYVSGYIETVPPPGEEKLVGADASHAWFSVYFPGFGWVDYDPTNNLLPQDQHITVAWGRDFGDVTPLKGLAYGSGGHELTVSVDVQPLDRPD